MIKSYFDEKPQVFEKIERGKYYYRWNIKQHNFQTENGEKQDWEADQIIVYAPLSSNKILEKAIEYLWESNAEQKLLNDYNAANLGILDETYIEKYKTFLTERKVLKTQVEKDCLEYNIK